MSNELFLIVLLSALSFIIILPLLFLLAITIRMYFLKKEIMKELDCNEEEFQNRLRIEQIARGTGRSGL